MYHTPVRSLQPLVQTRSPTWAPARLVFILAEGADVQPLKSEHSRSLASRLSHWPHLPFLSWEAEGCVVGSDLPFIGRTTLDKFTSLSLPWRCTCTSLPSHDASKRPGVSATADCRLQSLHYPVVSERA